MTLFWNEIVAISCLSWLPCFYNNFFSLVHIVKLWMWILATFHWWSVNTWIMIKTKIPRLLAKRIWYYFQWQILIFLFNKWNNMNLAVLRYLSTTYSALYETIRKRHFYRFSNTLQSKANQQATMTWYNKKSIELVMCTQH